MLKPIYIFQFYSLTFSPQLCYEIALHGQSSVSNLAQAAPHFASGKENAVQAV